jgi:hypothetical protein
MSLSKKIDIYSSWQMVFWIILSWLSILTMTLVTASVGPLTKVMLHLARCLRIFVSRAHEIRYRNSLVNEYSNFQTLSLSAPQAQPVRWTLYLHSRTCCHTTGRAGGNAPHLCLILEHACVGKLLMMFKTLDANPEMKIFHLLEDSSRNLWSLYSVLRKLRKVFLREFRKNKI